MGQILRVTTAFSFLSDPAGHAYTPGEIVDLDKDPYVKRRDQSWIDAHFETVEAHVARRSGVEQATAEPGARRARSRAKKQATVEPEPTPVVEDETTEDES